MALQAGSERTLEDAAELCELASSLLSKEPNEEILNALTTIAPFLSQRIGDDTAHHLDNLATSYRNELNVNSLRQEFSELFISSYSGRYIPPYESAFRSTVETGRLCRPSEAVCAELEACYFRFGFMPAKLKMDIRVKALGWSDHIAIELAFLAFLLRIAKEREGPEGLDFTLLFVQRHVNGWITIFSDILFQQSATAYFKFVAHLLREIVKLNERLAELSTHPHALPRKLG